MSTKSRQMVSVPLFDIASVIADSYNLKAVDAVKIMRDKLKAALAGENSPDADVERKRNDAARGLTHVTCAVRADGWLFIKHADGQWVSAAQLQPFSMGILRNAGSIE